MCPKCLLSPILFRFKNCLAHERLLHQEVSRTKKKDGTNKEAINKETNIKFIKKNVHFVKIALLAFSVLILCRFSVYSLTILNECNGYAAHDCNRLHKRLSMLSPSSTLFALSSQLLVYSLQPPPPPPFSLSLSPATTTVNKHQNIPSKERHPNTKIM